jgi:putative DNA primase/helicase
MNPIEYRKFLHGNNPGWVEYRALPSEHRKWLAQDKETFTLPGVWLEQNVYYGVLLRNEKGHGKATDVLPAPLCWVEIDLKNTPYVYGENVLEMSPEALRSAAEQLLADLWEDLNRLNITPKIIIYSGHGLQLIFALNETIDLDTLEATNRWLAKELKGDPNATDRARVLRFPESRNNKNPNRIIDVEIWHTNEIDTNDTTLFGQITREKIDYKTITYETNGTITDEDRTKLLNKWTELKHTNENDYGRHQLSLYTAGWLKSNNVTEPNALAFIQHLAHDANDEELDKRLKNVRTTYARADKTRGFEGLQTDFKLELTGIALPVVRVQETVRSAKLPRENRGPRSDTEFYAMPELPNEVSERSDRANALILEHNLSSTFKYTHGMGWLEWVSTHWESADARPINETAQRVLISAISLVVELRREEKNNNTDKNPETIKALEERFKDACKWLSAVNHAEKIKQALEIAKGLKGFCVPYEIWDQDPNLINLRNGVLDLMTLELQPHHQNFYMTKKAQGAYEPGATDPDVAALMDLLERDGRREFVMRVLGSCLHGKAARDEILTVFRGTGGAGKGSLIEILKKSLGTYATAIPTELLMVKTHQSSGPQPELLVLRGARLIHASETGQGDAFKADLVKRITGGDPISTRKMHSNIVIEFTVNGKLIIATNHDPKIDPRDTGMQRRLRVVPFKAKPEKVDTQFKARLGENQSAWDAFISLLVIECSQWLEHGLLETSVVTEETGKYWHDQDLANQFIEERLVFSDLNALQGSELLEIEKDWYSGTAGGNISPKFQGEVARVLLERGVRKGAVNGRVIWRGVSFKSDS